MRLFRVDEATGVPVNQFGSQQLVLSRIAQATGTFHVGVMHLGPQGVIGCQEATIPQLFLVIQGSGWVRGNAAGRVLLPVGQAAFWEAGEWHEAGTETGMTVLVVESAVLDPTQFMLFDTLAA